MPESVHRAPGGVGYAPSSDTRDPVQNAEAVARSGVAGQSGGNIDGVPLERKKYTAFSASKPELPPVQSDKVDWSKMDAQSILAILGLEQNKRSLESSSADVKLSMTQQKDTAERRLKEIETATKKAEEAKAKENSFWSKFCKLFSAVSSTLGSLVSLAMGSMLMFTGVASVVGALLIAHSLTGLAGGVMDGLVGLGLMDDPGWRPSLAQGTAKLMELMGVDPKVAGIIGMVTEIAVVVTLNVMAYSKIASVAKEMAESLSQVVSQQMAAQMATQFTTAMTLGRTGTFLQIGGSAGKSGADIGTQVINIEVANLQYESDMAQARAEEIKAAMARLAKTLQMDMEMVETLIKRIEANTQVISDTVSGTAEANKSIAANMGQGGSAA